MALLREMLLSAMRILIALNIAIPFFLAVTMVAGEKWELMVLPGGALILLLLALVPINIGFILWCCKKYRLRVMIPLLTFMIAAGLSFFALDYGSKLMLRGTPCSPESFFNNQTRLDLTQAAQQMMTEHQRDNFSAEIVTTAQKHSLKPIFVDDNQQIVMFGYYHLRHRYEYIWATNGLTEPYSMDSTITASDIKKWTDLKRIVRQGATATQAERQRMEFEPTIAFPLLKDSLGIEFIEHLRTVDDFSDDDKSLVLGALNKQRLASSALVENPLITYGNFKFGLFNSSGLCVAGSDYNGEVDGFWESKLARQLLSEGVLLYASDGRHLKIKTNLTEKQRREVEWLHVGLMQLIYRNLLSKNHYTFRKNLGDNWYFNVR